MLIHQIRNLALSTLWKTCSLARLQKRLVVVTFHRVLKEPDFLRPDEICADEFYAAMQVLRDNFPVIPLGDALERLNQGKLQSGGLSITFDDGYRDNVDIALPVLVDLGMSATFFIATGFLDGGIMWNDIVIEAVRRLPGEEIALSNITEGPVPIRTNQQRANLVSLVLNRLKHLERGVRQARVDELASLVSEPLPDDLMMRGSDIRRLTAAGMELGGHTIDHPILSKESEQEALRQIAEGRAKLAELSASNVSVFAYPNGRPNQDYGRREASLVKRAGFRAGLTTSWGSIHSGSDPYQLPRISLWDWRPINIGFRICQSLYSDGEVAAT